MFSLRKFKMFLLGLTAGLVLILPSLASAQEELFVSALIEGTKFTASSTVTYRFTIIGGASEVCPPESQPDHPEMWGWVTEILIYKNKPVEWYQTDPQWPYLEPINWDFVVGDSAKQPTYEQAEEIGKGMFVDIPLEENDYVLLICPDSKDCFWDNSGGVNFSISIVEELIIETTVDIDPDTLNLESKGEWITCYIWLPEGYDVADIKPESILLNGQVTPDWGRVDETGQMLIVKFNRSEVQDILNVGEVEITISGELTDGTKFQATDTITVIDKGGKK